MKKTKSFNGCIKVPGDKSITHRAIMLGAIAEGSSVVDGFLPSEDCNHTIACFEKMGVFIKRMGETKIKISGVGLHGLKEPKQTLYVGNSGTTARLLTGLLSGQKFASVIDGDDSIRHRPMDRVITPLSLMGADIQGGNCPLTIRGTGLEGIEYYMNVASAQVKSAIMLAALYAGGETIINEPIATRNHTELMLEAFEGNITYQDGSIVIGSIPRLSGAYIDVPGDISSAAYWMALGLLAPNSCITILNVGINETRSGIIEALTAMGANIELSGHTLFANEPVCDITVRTSALTGIEISGEMIPRLIDELPVLAVIAAFAKGKTVIKDAGELKVKESNRIAAMTAELKKAGVDVVETPDGMIINGGKNVNGASFHTYNDHRIAMSLAVLASLADGESVIENREVCCVSYPSFFDELLALAEGSASELK